jgi:hypothetical protein
VYLKAGNQWAEMRWEILSFQLQHDVIKKIAPSENTYILAGVSICAQGKEVSCHEFEQRTDIGKYSGEFCRLQGPVMNTGFNNGIHGVGTF